MERTHELDITFIMTFIPVTKSFLPPINEYTAHVLRAYECNWLTNRGMLVKELEEKLSNYLELEDNQILLTTNGTIPLQIALKLLGKGGEIITTPFSYVATTAAIVWEQCTPVFVDIHPDYLTIDETKIEAAITDKTTCILATHVYGNPCNVEVIDAIAKKHHLKVIYDAAHCFGVTYKGQSIFNYGDVSTCSFHATKLFHTAEGGAIFCKDKQLYDQIYYSHNFGHNGPLDFYGLGINAKISELQAAMGLAVLPYMTKIIQQREHIINQYNEKLNFTCFKKIKIRENTNWNSSYYPIIFSSENELLMIESKLKKHHIMPRRYFYPSLNRLPYVDNQNMMVSDEISKRIMCLPLYVGLSDKTIDKVCKIINEL